MRTVLRRTVMSFTHHPAPMLLLCAVVIPGLLAAPIRAGDVEVTGIQAVHRHGQTFVTWKDVAEGEAGARYRYSLYRAEEPITAANLARLYGTAW
jgi:hypothetical protein